MSLPNFLKPSALNLFRKENLHFFHYTFAAKFRLVVHCKVYYIYHLFIPDAFANIIVRATTSSEIGKDLLTLLIANLTECPVVYVSVAKVLGLLYILRHYIERQYNVWNQVIYIVTQTYCSFFLLFWVSSIL